MANKIMSSWDGQADWIAICTNLGFPSVSFGMFQDIKDMYGDKAFFSKRIYHNWKHIEDCVEKMADYMVYEASQGRSMDSFSVNLLTYALIMHDVIYTPGSNRNEQDSAIFARSIAGSDIATNLIMTTKKHGGGTRLDGLDAVISDVDMSILGSEPGPYQAYKISVQGEAGVSDPQWAHGRTTWLRSVLAGPIFNTEYFKSKYEDQARCNLIDEYDSYGVRYTPPQEF